MPRKTVTRHESVRECEKQHRTEEHEEVQSGKGCEHKKQAVAVRDGGPGMLPDEQDGDAALTVLVSNARAERSAQGVADAGPEHVVEESKGKSDGPSMKSTAMRDAC